MMSTKYEQVTNRLYIEFDSAVELVRRFPSRREHRRCETLATKCLKRITPDGGDYIRSELRKLSSFMSE